jgi:hypothetical protein
MFPKDETLCVSIDSTAIHTNAACLSALLLDKASGL